jgi:hypothetical protein
MIDQRSEPPAARLCRLLALVLLWPAAAQAESPRAEAGRVESPPIVIAPFSLRCFDGYALAARLRAQLPDAEVLVGSAPPGAHQWVQVRSEPPNLVVHISLLNDDKRVVGRAERLIPDENDCAALLDTISLMVARAATPLAFRAPPSTTPRGKHPVRQPDHRASPPSENRTPPPSENRTPPSSENRTPPPSENRTPPSSENRTPPPSENRTPPPSENRTPPPSENRTPPPSENRTPRPPENRTSENRTTAAQTAPSPKPGSEIHAPAISRARHRFEIDFAARWGFPLDGPPSTPGGDATLGWRWWRRRVAVGIGARVGVSAEWSASTAPPDGGVITVFARRIPVAAELRLDVDIPRARGVFRISAGPEAVVWLARSTGLPRPGSAVFAEAGAFVRGAYRLELGPAVLTAGVDLEVAFKPDRLKIGGVGTVGETQVVQISPFVGAGVGFF